MIEPKKWNPDEQDITEVLPITKGNKEVIMSRLVDIINTYTLADNEVYGYLFTKETAHFMTICKPILDIQKFGSRIFKKDEILHIDHPEKGLIDIVFYKEVGDN